MDIQYICSVLLTGYNVNVDNYSLSTDTPLDIYYKRHASADKFYMKVTPFFLMIGFGLIAIGFLQ